MEYSGVLFNLKCFFFIYYINMHVFNKIKKKSCCFFFLFLKKGMISKVNYNKVSPNAHLAMAQPAEMVLETWIS